MFLPDPNFANKTEILGTIIHHTNLATTNSGNSWQSFFFCNKHWAFSASQNPNTAKPKPPELLRAMHEWMNNLAANCRDPFVKSTVWYSPHEDDRCQRTSVYDENQNGKYICSKTNRFYRLLTVFLPVIDRNFSISAGFGRLCWSKIETHQLTHPTT